MAKKYDVKLTLIDDMEDSNEASIKEVMTEAIEGGFDDLMIVGEINVMFLEDIIDEEKEEIEDEEENEDE